jgi:hypothetical protein
MASYISDVGKQAKRNIVRSVLGSSAIGRALSKTILKKGKDEEESVVEEALQEQTQVQEENNATVVRIESVVLNIADNIYNIAAVWSDHIVSMEEANRLQQERISKEQAQKEENENEASKLLAPLPSGTSPTESSGKKGLLSELMGSVGGTKNMLRGLMKKFAVLAAGVVATGGLLAGTAAMANENEPDKLTQKEQTSESDSQDVTYDEMGNPISRSSDTPPEQTTSQPQLPSTTPVPPVAAATTVTKSSSASAPPTPVSSPSVTSTQSTTTQTGQQFVVKTPNGPLTFQSEEQYKKWNEDPSKFAISITPESGGVRSVVVPLTQQISPQIINNLRGGTNAPADVKNIFSQVQSNLSTPPSAGSSGGSLGGTSDSGPSTSLMPSLPSTGAELGRASTALDAAFSQMREASNQIIQTSTNSQSPDSMASPTPIPSPIASRGMLDIGTTFTTYY